jgi:O-antigen ligase
MQARVGTWSRAATFATGFVLLATVALADGGYFRETWVWTTLALCALAWTALVLRARIEIGRLELAAIAALAGFVGWVALSAFWSPTPEATIEEAERGVMYVAGVLAVVLAVDREALREYFAGIAAAAVLVVAYGLGERLLEPVRTDPTQGTLPNEPFGYANALAIFAALGLLVSIGLAASARSKAAGVVWCTPAIVLIPALVWTDSRGAWLAFVVGLVVLAAIERDRIVAVARAAPRPLVIAGLIAAAVLAVAAAAAGRDRPLGPRIDYWTVALDQWRENVWLGSGAGTFAIYWLREESESAVLDAHSLYVESLAEVGPVGLTLLVVALSIPIVAAVRSRGHPLAGAGAGAYTAFLVHAGLDWDWEMPAVTLAGLLCGIGLLLAGRRNVDEITLAARERVVLALGAFAVAGLAVAGAVTH